MKTLKKTALFLLIFGALIFLGAPLGIKELLRQQTFYHLERLQNQGIMIDAVKYQDGYGHSTLNFNFYGTPVEIQHHFDLTTILSGFWLKSTAKALQYEAQGEVNLSTYSKIFFNLPAMNFQGLNLPQTPVQLEIQALWDDKFSLNFGNQLQLSQVQRQKALSLQSLDGAILSVEPNWAKQIGLLPVLILYYGHLILPSDEKGNYQFQILFKENKMSLHKYQPKI